MHKIDQHQLFRCYEPPPHGWQRLQQRINGEPLRQYRWSAAFALVLLIAPILVILTNQSGQPVHEWSLHGVVANHQQPGLRLEVDGQWRDMPAESINGALWVELEDWQ